MSYVRTKEGIYKKYEDTAIDRVYQDVYLGGDKVPSKIFIEKESIIKQADAIKDLCDEFIVWEEDYPTPLTMSMSEKEKYEQMKKVILLGLNVGLNCWLKLGIWTDKGLTFVAKMNKEGGFELL